MEWIALKDQKPPAGEGVLITNGEKVTVACVADLDWIVEGHIHWSGHEWGGYEWEFESWVEDDDVTHWMPLPEPPK